MVGATQRAHSRNLKDPYDTDAAHRLTFPNGASFTATGTDFDGVSQFGDTHLSVPNIGDAALMYYSTEPSTAANDVSIGSFNAGGREIYLQIKNGSGSSVYTAGGNSYVLGPEHTNGLITGASLNGVVSLYRNAVLVATAGGGYTTDGLDSLYLGALHYLGGTSNLGNANCATAAVWLGLSDAEVAAIYTIIQQFQQALGRAV